MCDELLLDELDLLDDSELHFEAERVLLAEMELELREKADDDDADAATELAELAATLDALLWLDAWLDDADE